MLAGMRLLRLSLAFLLLSGCTEEVKPPRPSKYEPGKEPWKVVPPPAAAPKTDPEGSPEAAYRNYMLTNLEGTEAKIRPLIIDRPGSEVLWQGPYTADIAQMLSAQYRSMDIVRVGETPTKVTFTSSAAPMPVDVVLVGKQWKIDPSPIIQFRKAMAQ